MNEDPQSAHAGVQPRRKHGGRKPGSKNKPKAERLSSERAVLRDALAARDRQLSDLQAQVAALHGIPVERPSNASSLSQSSLGILAEHLSTCIGLLQESLDIRISAMASESQLADLVRRQQALARLAIEQLRAVYA